MIGWMQQVSCIHLITRFQADTRTSRQNIKEE